MTYGRTAYNPPTNKGRELTAVKSATYLIAGYHRGRLQSTPLGKLCTDDSA